MLDSAAKVTPARLHLQVDYGIGTLRLSGTVETRGQRIVIEGPSGVGKSTALTIIAGLREGGVAVKFGNEVWEDNKDRIFIPAWKRQVGWLPQDARLFPHLSVRAQILFAKTPTLDILEDVCQSLQIEPLLRRYPRHLSGGEKQRVALARALLSRPRLLLLDEPFSSLDGNLRRAALSLIDRVAARQGLLTVMTSHDGSRLDGWPEQTWKIENGRLIDRRDQSF